MHSKTKVTSSLGTAGYFSVCVQLYCVGFHCFTTRFGLHGHLQVCRIFYFHMLEGFSFAAFFGSLPLFFTWLHSARFHLWGGLNTRYYYLPFVLFLVLLYVCFYLLLFFLFSFIIFVVSLCVCLSACSFFVVCLFCATICCLFHVVF
jgi:hypothetical protein